MAKYWLWGSQVADKYEQIKRKVKEKYEQIDINGLLFMRIIVFPCVQTQRHQRH